MQNDVLMAVPEWTEFRKKTGLDPLGMQNSSVRLYQSLVPGISNVTLRVRYYGLYAWLSQAYARTIGDTDIKRWQQFIRRAEALYALIAAVRGGETGVAGANWAARKVMESEGRRIAFAADADPGSPTHYLKQAWGAYGAAYASQLFEIGIFSRSDTHEIPLPSKEIGEALARVFAEAVGDLGERFLRIMERGSVSHVELNELAEMSPSRIRRNGKERASYERILFAKAGLKRSQDIERQRTLLLVLDLARLLEREPSVWDVRWCLYSGCLDEGARWNVDEALEVHRQRWKLYHANDLSHIAFESILKFILDRLESHPAGVPLAQLISEAASEVLSSMGKVPVSWSNFTRELHVAVDASADSDANSEFVLSNFLIEAMRRGRVFTSETCVLALQLLGVVHRRVEPLRSVLDTEFGTLDPNGFRSLLTELRFVDANSELGLKELLYKLFEERVVRRHLWVALRKLRYQNDYTFLIDADDGLVRLRQKDGPVWTTPRMDPSITFLNDIGLIDHDGLTKRGRDLLAAA
jgi:hypothetical protein